VYYGFSRGQGVNPALSLTLTFSLQNSIFPEWAMLGSNQRPLPCEGSTIVCRRFLEVAKFLQIGAFSLRRLSQHFRRFTRVAAHDQKDARGEWRPFSESLRGELRCVA
jgi:hypothetical protein